MSTIKVNRAQLGQSATATQNFTLTAEAADGTIKLARGNAGATTQDILTVDASGHVFVGGNDLNLFSNRSLSANGYQKLPSGLIIQWGSVTVTSNAGSLNQSFPLAFPNVPLFVMTSHNDQDNVFANASIEIVSASQFSIGVTMGTRGLGRTLPWIAIGY